MAMWLYQMNQGQWSPNKYRLDIWEGERWVWPVGKKLSTESPTPGDRVVFFYAPAGGTERGFYGWAIILDWREDEEGERRMYFRPVAPSDHLKMHPWWDETAKGIADRVRGAVKRGTLWEVPGDLSSAITGGVTAWLGHRPGEPDHLSE